MSVMACCRVLVSATLVPWSRDVTGYIFTLGLGATCPKGRASCWTVGSPRAPGAPLATADASGPITVGWEGPNGPTGLLHCPCYQTITPSIRTPLACKWDYRVCSVSTPVMLTRQIHLTGRGTCTCLFYGAVPYQAGCACCTAAHAAHEEACARLRAEAAFMTPCMFGLGEALPEPRAENYACYMAASGRHARGATAAYHAHRGGRCCLRLHGNDRGSAAVGVRWGCCVQARVDVLPALIGTPD